MNEVRPGTWLNRLGANHATFQTVTFQAGLNVILADRTQESTKKDTRNGLGKSTLIDIIHFCLGGDAGPLTPEALPDWAFTLEMAIDGKALSATRATDRPQVIEVSGDIDVLPMRPEVNDETGALEFPRKEWTRALGTLVFGLPVDPPKKYAPNFRGLISYFARRTRDGYSTPFEHHRKQLAVQVQVDNAFLLGLGAEYAVEWQLLKDEEEELKQLQRTAKTGSFRALIGSVGELEAVQVRLQGKTTREGEELATFRVHPQYAELQQQANALTEQLIERRNANLSDQRMLDLYGATGQTEAEPDEGSIISMYAQAGVDLPGAVKKSLAEVREFHARLVTNRKAFLADELRRLRHDIAARNREIEVLDRERSVIMETLSAFGALEEYSALQRIHATTVSDLRDVERRIALLKEVEGRSIQLNINRQLLLQRAHRDLDERQEQKRRAVELFNANSEALYNRPGTLAIEIGEKGFKFRVDIDSSGSSGIESMKVFCYDLMLAQLWSQRPQRPAFLVHDSILYDPVDGRQTALALQLAASEAESRGFQYICTMNSDMVPFDDFTEGFDLEAFVRLRLTDEAGDKGRLLGRRFDSD
jgi:uncharacterized protein YydD (DUF2326 family)